MPISIKAILLSNLDLYIYICLLYRHYKHQLYTYSIFRLSSSCKIYHKSPSESPRQCMDIVHIANTLTYIFHEPKIATYDYRPMAILSAVDKYLHNDGNKIYIYI